MEPNEQKTAPEARESEFIEEFGRYVIELERDGRLQGWARITPAQGVFDVEVWARITPVVQGMTDMKVSETRELTVEDVRKVLAQSDIKLPESLAEKLSDWRQECWESPEMEDEMHMAAAEAWDLDGQLTPEEVEMIYGLDERVRLFGPPHQ